MKTFLATCRFWGSATIFAALAGPLAWSSSSNVEVALAQCSSLDRFVTARLEWEAWQLQQLAELYARGHAMWVELDQQRVRHGAWRARQQAVSQLNRFLMDLAETTANDDTIVNEEMIPCRFPGSLRLAGWFDVRHVPFEMLSAYVETQRSVPLYQELKARRTIVVEKCAEAENELRVLEGISGEDRKLLRDRKRARLLLKWRLAELGWIDQGIRQEELARVRLSQLTEGLKTRRTALGTRPGFRGSETGFLLAGDSGDRIRKLTLRIAQLESTDANVRVAEVDYTMALDKVRAVSELHQLGAASADELAAVKSQAERAAAARDASNVVARHPQRVTAIQSDEPLWASEQVTSSPAKAEDCLDPDWFKYTAVVNQLIELKFQFAELEVCRRIIEAHIVHVDELIKRLEAAHLAATNVPERQGYGQREHRAARDREIRALCVQKQLLFARRVAAENRCAVVALESQRFLVQLQTPPHANQIKQLPIHWGETCYVAAGAARWDGCPLNCVQRIGGLEVECMPLERRSRPYPALVGDDHFHDSTSRRCQVVSTVLPRHAKDIWLFDHFQSHRLENSWDRFGVGRIDLNDERSSMRFPSYSEFYAFGIRRADSRSTRLGSGRATPYGGPWYFPGSPTNYR